MKSHTAWAKEIQNRGEGIGAKRRRSGGRSGGEAEALILPPSQGSGIILFTERLIEMVSEAKVRFGKRMVALLEHPGWMSGN